ncbi:hypothetical protein GCM10009741_04410 [Kribbella lupini]|uniref:MYXO-CTERM domain-containing protein n=1 Tax=Kribbella lupini TaxID=291602 RepID=A0ABP4KV78_9ACTN
MNRRHSAMAVAALALCGAGLTATEVTAQVIPEPSRSNTLEYNYPEYKLDVPMAPIDPAPKPVDGAGADVVPVAASGLGGAGVALAALWIYRRRQATAG